MGNGNLAKKLSIRQRFDSKETSGEQAFGRNRDLWAKEWGQVCLSSAGRTIMETRLSLWNKATYTFEFRARILSHQRL